MKSTLKISLILVVALSSTGAVAKDWSTLRIATEGAYPPWNFSEASGQLVGYDVDVSHELCRRMKAKCEIVAQNWDGIIPSLNAGKYDAIVAAMVVTPERAAAVDFTQPYGLMQLSFLTAKANPLSKAAGTGTVISLDKDRGELADAVENLKPFLKGKIIGVQTSTTQVQFMEKYFGGIAEVREYKAADAMVLDLTSGRIDATLDGVGFLGGVLSSADGADLTFFGPKFNGGLFGGDSSIAVRKSDIELKTKLNDALKEAVADGTLKKLSMKWFHIDISPKQ